ncbi:hypothetical protein GCM10023215_61860 [Pseudonocardia yuanmonensis]|uniref:Uncharacterized protein n=1 Tax=Pseudonocardia yuanmonensis TaxID=1095914 RepID=A0ABP8XPQ6_9PSEU
MVRPHKGRSLRVSGEVLVDAVPDTLSRLVWTRSSTPRRRTIAISFAGPKRVTDGARTA